MPVVVKRSKEIPIFYRVIVRNGPWKVYDVVVENVSMVQNYRTQFNEILVKNTPEGLLAILRKKVKEQQVRSNRSAGAEYLCGPARVQALSRRLI